MISKVQGWRVYWALLCRWLLVPTVLGSGHQSFLKVQQQ